MNIDQLRKRFADEDVCRSFFESVLWRNGRFCPHCQCAKSYLLKGKSVRAGLYECAECKRRFTVTVHTPMHSTKLQRYLHEFEFRLNHRMPEMKLTRKGNFKLVMVQMPLMDRLRSLLSKAKGRQLRRTKNGGIVGLNPS